MLSNAFGLLAASVSDAILAIARLADVQPYAPSFKKPRWRRSRNKPPKRKLHANLAHRSKRVRRKHRRAA